MRISLVDIFEDPLRSLFAPLRILTVLGSLVWIFYTIQAVPVRIILLITIGGFAIYSTIFYFILKKYISYFKRIYLLLLIPDIIFVSIMVHYTGHLQSSPFFLGYYLVGALFSFYYGLQIGLIAVILSIISILLPVFPGHIQPEDFLQLLFKIVFMGILAFGAGSISEQNRLFNSARERLVEKLRLLHDVNNRLMTRMDLNQRLSLIAQEGAKALNTKSCVVMLYDENEKLVPREAFNVDEAALQSLRMAPRETIDSTFAGMSAKSGETITVENILRLNPEHPFRVELERHNLKSVLCTPIVYEERRLGVFCNYHDEPIRVREEEHDIAATFAAQIAFSIENAKLVKRIIEKEEAAFRAELRIAKELQTRFLPKQAPQVKDIEVGLVYQPAKEVGGDFFDFFRIDDKLVFSIGDVVGKGTPAALFVSLMSYASDALARFNIDPQNILKEMNEVLLERTSSDFFVTMSYTEFVPDSRKLVIHNAGHFPPLHYDVETGLIEYLEIKGLLLGIEKNVNYPSKEVVMHSGDIVLFYTDGLIEARRPDKEPIGMEGLKNVFKNFLDLPAQELAEKMRDECLLGTIEYLNDDCTIIVVKGK